MAIQGPISAFVGHQVFYVADGPGPWTVPSNCHIDSGDGTNLIYVTWTGVSSDSSIQVIVGGFTESLDDINVTVDTPPSITQTPPSAICEGIPFMYSVTSAGTTYKWLVDGGMIIGPDNLNIVNVQWMLSGSRMIEVLISDGADSSGSLLVTVNPMPAPNISGLSTVVTGSSETYVTASSSDSFTWTIVGGTGSSTTNSITVSWGGTTGPGSVSVQQSNGSCEGSFTLNTNIVNALSPLWANYVNTYPSDAQPGILALATVAYSSPNNLDLPSFGQQDSPTVSDIITGITDTSYNDLSANSIQSNITSILSNCTPDEELDQIFFHSVGRAMARGVQSLVNTLSQQTGSTIGSLKDLNSMTQSQLSEAIAALPCSHYLNVARSQSELTKARAYLDSVTTRYQGRLKLQSTLGLGSSGGSGLNGLFIASLSNPSDLTSVISTAKSDSLGNVNLPFSYINDGSTPPSNQSVNIMVYDTNGNQLFTDALTVNLPLDDSTTPTSVTVSPPAPISFTAATIAAVVSLESLTISTPFGDYLQGLSNTHKGTGSTPDLRDIRQVGGIMNDPDASAFWTDPAAPILDAHADLELISQDITTNKALREAGYTSLLVISSTVRSAFISDTYSILGDFNAYTIYLTAIATVSYYNNQTLNWRVQNGK